MGREDELAAVTLTNKENIAIISLNNPPVNALTEELLDDFTAAFSSICLDETAAVLITGSETCFSAGANIKAFLPNGAEKNQEYFDRIYAMFRQIESCPVPVIAAVNGIAMGAGLELSLCADLRVVDEKARLGATSVNLGLVFCTQRLPRLIGYSRASKMLYTAEVIGAKEAMESGLAHYVAPAGQSLDLAEKVAQMIATKGPAALRGVKQAFQAGQGLELDKAMEKEREQLFTVFATQDFQDRVENFLNARGKHKQ